MNYLTKGEFIQALKDYHYIEELLQDKESEKERLEYLRYDKIKSSLDYDVVGYDKKGNALRQLKGHNIVNSEQITTNRELLDKKLDVCIGSIEKFKGKLSKCDSELKVIDEPLRDILHLKYREHYKLKDVCKKHKEMYLDESGMYKYIMRELDKYYTPTHKE